MGTWQEEMKQLWFLDFVVSPKDKNKIYFSAGWFNGLVELNIVTGQKKILCKFPNERNLVGGLHENIICVEDKLYFCPRCTNFFCVYDCKTGQIYSYKLPENDIYWTEREIKFAKLVAHEEFIYLIPWNYNQVLRFNIEEKKFFVFDKWFVDYEHNIGYKKQKRKFIEMFSNHIICDDVFLWQDIETQIFILFERKTGDVSYIEGPSKKIVSVENSENNQYVICEDGTCWAYNSKKRMFEYKYSLSIDINCILYQFVRVNNTFFIPLKTSNELIVYDAYIGNGKRVAFKTDGKQMENAVAAKWGLAFVWIKKLENQLWLLNQYNEVICYNIKEQTYQAKHFLLDREYAELDWIEEIDMYADKYTYFPNKSKCFDIFIRHIKGINKKAKARMGENIGKRIFAELNTNTEDK